MANVMRLIYEPKAEDIKMFAVDTGSVIEVGDLVYHDTNDVKPASDFTYGASLEVTQANFAAVFAGIAMNASRSGETNPIAVAQRGLAKMICASATFEVGDRLNVDDNAGGTALVDQQVIAVDDNAVAIGKVARRVASAATAVIMEFEASTRATKGQDIQSIVLYEGLITAAADLVTSFTFGRPVELARLWSVVTVLTAGAGVLNLEKAAVDLTDTLTIADASAVGTFDSVDIDTAAEGYFDADDALSIECDGTPTAGQAIVGIDFRNL